MIDPPLSRRRLRCCARRLDVRVGDLRGGGGAPLLRGGHRLHIDDHLGGHLWPATPADAAAAAAGRVRRSVPAERVPDAARHPVGEAARRAAEAALVLLQQAHVVLQLGGGHLDVAGVPEHPPHQAEEDDDGARVDEQVVEEDVGEDPDEEDEQPHRVEGHRGPEGAGAAAQAPVLGVLHAVSPAAEPVPQWRLIVSWSAASRRGIEFQPGPPLR